LLRWTERCFCVAGIAALGFATFTLLEGKLYQSYQTYAFHQALVKRPASVAGFLIQWEERLGLRFSRPKQTRPQEAAEADGNLESTTAELPSPPVLSTWTQLPPQDSSLGLLQIPRLRLSVVILEGDDDRTLRLGAGHLRGTALPGQPGNFAVAAHRDTYFRVLKDIRKDDAIRVTTLQGSFDYVVQSTEIVQPSDTKVMRASSRPSLTLITCFPFYFVGPAPQRFIVHATQADSTLANTG
jgi:LPXTG-site transpeptidase (sortase) family protein